MPLDDIDFQRKGYVMRSLQSPKQQKEFEKLAATCLSDWGSSASNVSQILEKEIMKSSYPLIENKDLPPPPSYIKNMIHRAKMGLHSTVNPRDSVRKLIEFLTENNLKFSVLEDNNACITAISYHDPVLTPIPHEACAVYTSDVTFGITDPLSGISKWSFFSRLIAGKISNVIGFS